MDIPRGKTREEIKICEKIIKDFYARWIANNPSKSVWNESLKANIKVKFISINETYEHAARSYESTLAVLRLTEILSNAVFISRDTKKTNDKNQKSFSHLCIMRYENVKLVVGYQKSKDEYVQYSITSSNAYKADKKKSRLGCDF